MSVLMVQNVLFEKVTQLWLQLNQRSSFILYELNCEQQVLKTEFATKMYCLYALHQHYGQRHLESFKTLVSKSLATGIHIDICNQGIFCDTYAKGKLARLPFPKASKTMTGGILDLIHSDLRGPV